MCTASSAVLGFEPLILSSKDLVLSYARRIGQLATVYYSSTTGYVLSSIEDSSQKILFSSKFLKTLNMPTFPSRLRLEPLLDLHQDITNPQLGETSLVQNVEVFDNRISLYFGLLFYFSLFQAQWKIEIAIRMVLFWQDTEEPVTPRSSPSPVPVLPPQISISPVHTETALPTSPTTSYYEADEGTAQDTAPMDLTPTDHPLSPITAHTGLITISSDNAPQERASPLIPSAPLYTETEQLRRNLALSYPSNLVSASEQTSGPSNRHPLLRSPSPTSNSLLFSNSSDRREQWLDYFTQAQTDRAWLPTRFILADDFDVRGHLIFSRSISYSTFKKMVRLTTSTSISHPDYEYHSLNLMIDYIVHQKELPQTLLLGQWLDLTQMTIRIENEIGEPAARPSLIRMLFDARPADTMPNGVRSAELDMLDRSAPDTTLGVPMLPAISRLDLELPAFDSTTFPSLDPVTLALRIDVLDLDSLGLDLNNRTTDGRFETSTVCKTHFMESVTFGLSLPSGTNIIRPYQEILDFLKCNAEIIIFLRGSTAEYVTHPILYIRTL